MLFKVSEHKRLDLIICPYRLTPQTFYLVEIVTVHIWNQLTG